MSKTIHAVYEDGVLKPKEPLDLAEHQEVEIILESSPPCDPVRTLLRFIRDPIERPLEEMVSASEVEAD
jgi:predicted DNA-binding antitoxin AbrB/MazE fold protein